MCKAKCTVMADAHTNQRSKLASVGVATVFWVADPTSS